MSFRTLDLYGSSEFHLISSYFIPLRWCIATCATSRTCQPAALAASILAKAHNIEAPLPERGHGANCLKCFNCTGVKPATSRVVLKSCASEIRVDILLLSDSRLRQQTVQEAHGLQQTSELTQRSILHYLSRYTHNQKISKRSAWKYFIIKLRNGQCASYPFALRTVVV